MKRMVISVGNDRWRRPIGCTGNPEQLIAIVEEQLDTYPEVFIAECSDPNYCFSPTEPH